MAGTRLQAELQDQLRSYALIEAAQVAIQTRDYPRAIDALKQALALDPENSKAYFSLGTACSRLGRTEQAKEYFGQSRQILDRHRRLKELTDDLVGDPMNAELRYEVATILRKLDRAEEAQRWLLTVLHLDPHHKKARDAFVEYSQAHKMHETPSHGQQRASPASSKPTETNAAPGK